MQAGWREAIAPALISFALALAVIAFTRDTVFAVPAIDAAEQVEGARLALDPSRVATQPYFHAPLYTWFLACVFSVFGPSLTAARVLGAAAGASGALVVHALGKRFFGSAEARLAAWGFALYGPIVFYLGELLNVAFLLLLHPLALLLLVRARERPSPSRLGLCGIVFGLAAVNRPDILPLAAVGLLASFLAAGGEGEPAPAAARRLARAVAFAAGMAVLLVPVGLRNQRASGRFVVLPVNSGLNFYIGNNPACERTIGLRPGGEWKALVQVPRQEVAGDLEADPGLSRHYLHRALAFARRDPGGELACLAFKVETLVNGYELPETFDLYSRRAVVPPLRLLVGRLGPLWLPFGLVLPLALVGLGAAWRDRRRTAWLLVALASYLMPLVGWWNGSRYRMAIVPLVLILAAAGAVALARAVRDRRWPQLLAGGGVLLAGLVAGNWPYRHFSKGYDFTAETLATAAIARGQQGRLDEAEALLLKSIARAPGYVEARTNLSWVRAVKGDTDGAVAELRRAMELRPADADLPTRLGGVLLAAGRGEEAIAAFESALAIDPAAAEAHYGIGNALAGRGSMVEAAAAYETALSLAPDHSRAALNLGASLEALGRLEAAIDRYRLAVRLDPNDALARKDLGLLCLRLGRLDEAEASLARALELAPGDAVVQAGIARLRQARGR